MILDLIIPVEFAVLHDLCNIIGGFGLGCGGSRVIGQAASIMNVVYIEGLRQGFAARV